MKRLIIFFALCFSMVVSAQTKREQHENDNYIWFETRVEGTAYSKGADFQDKQIIPNKYFRIDYLEEVDGALYFEAVDQYKNVALYNHRGKEIVPCSRGYKWLKYLPNYHSDKNGYGIWRALFTFSKDGKYGVVEGYTGTALLAPIYDKIESYTKNQFKVIKDGVTLSVSYNLEQINNIKKREKSTLSRIEKFSKIYNGQTYIKTIDHSKPENENVGIIFNGKQIIPSIYRGVSYEEKCNGLHYFVASIRNEHATDYLYNSLGKIIAKYEELDLLINYEKNSNDTYLLYKFEKDGKIGVLDGVTGDIIIESIYDDIENYDEGKFKVKVNDNYKYITYAISKLRNKNRNNTPKCYGCGGSGWYNPTVPGIITTPIRCTICGGTGNYVAPSNNSGYYSGSSTGNTSSGGNSSYGGGSINNGSSTSVGRDCQLCAGSGQCRTCMGRGYYYSSFDNSKTIPCPNCDRNHNGKCSSCHGSGKR